MLERFSLCARKVIRALSRASFALSGVALLSMMLLVTLDTSGRFFLNRPVRGTFEITEFLLVIIVLFSLAYTQSRKGHVRAEVLINHLSESKRTALQALFSLLGIVFLVMMVKQSFSQAILDFHGGLVSEILRIPSYPIKLCIPIGASLMTLELCGDFAEYIARLARKGRP